MSEHLILEVSEYKNTDRWLWTLKDGSGNYLADHTVTLSDNTSEDCGYKGYHDLVKYLEDYAVIEGGGDGQRKGEEILLARVGRWMGEEILGELRPILLEHVTHAGGMLSVSVVIPTEAQDLVFYPLELAWLEEGKSLAEAGARLIWRPAGAPDGSSKKKTDGPLRILGVFSLTTNADPLNLRKERVAFKRLLKNIADTKGLDIEVGVVQYGATRASLRRILREDPGWDIVHFSSHGAQGILVLEDEEGDADPISAQDLSELLRPSRPRLKLLILSACWSGSGLTHEQIRRRLGLPPQSEGQTEPDGDGTPSPVTELVDEKFLLPSLAQELVKALDCAVLAMRYPVGDEFAINLTAKLFHELLENRQPLAQSLQLALKDILSDDRYRDTVPTLSPITPLLVGPRGATLQFTPPKTSQRPEFKRTGLWGFPSASQHLVGRVGPMFRATKALAPDSEKTGVLFHGMVGGGKTACALELAHLHEIGRFQGFVFFKCPDEKEDIQSALVDCLEAVANQIDLEPATFLPDTDDTNRFRQVRAPQIRQFFKDNNVLVVLDNMESLLTDENNWRDEKWGDFVNALLDHDGLSRVVFTSRRVPVFPDGCPKPLVENITALSLKESYLLARELPNLRALLDDDSGGGPILLRDALEVIQGHPKILDLADKVAADRDRFADMVKEAREAAERDGAPLQTFLEAGESEQDMDAFAKSLREWTGALTGVLPPAARLLFRFLCRLEEEDRRLDYIQVIWPNFLKRLGDDEAAAKAALAETGGGLETALGAVVACGLAGREVRKIQRVELDEETKKPRLVMDERITFILHPGVAEAGRAAAPPALLDAADRELGDFHVAFFAQGIKTEMEGGGGLVVAAARRATPYLMRAARWEEASTLLERMIQRDLSPAALHWALPLLRRIAKKTEGTERENIDAGVLATALWKAGRYDEAEDLLKEVIGHCEEKGDWRGASVGAGQLANVIMVLRGPSEALIWNEKTIGFSRQAELGPWTQLSNEAQRLQILNAMGRWREVLDTVQTKRKEMENLPEKSDAEETANPWNVHEILLHVGAEAALDLEDWETGLNLNAEIVEWRRRRGVDEHEIARMQFNDYKPLLGLKRYPDARLLLERCRQVFKDERDYLCLGMVYTALAELEEKEDRPSPAAKFEKAALKYNYQVGQPEKCAVSHNNLSTYLERAGKPREIWLPQSLASALIRLQIGTGGFQTTLHNLALSDLPDSPPAFDDVADTIDSLEGVRFRDLFAKLPQTHGDGDGALAALWKEVKKEKGRMKEEKKKRGAVLASLPPEIQEALEVGDVEKFKKALEVLPKAEKKKTVKRLQEAGIIGAPQGPDMEKVILAFDPLLSAVADAAQGQIGDGDRQKIEADLDQLEKKGVQLREAVHRILSGERDPDALTIGIDPNSTQLITRILELIEKSSKE